MLVLSGFILAIDCVLREQDHHAMVMLIDVRPHQSADCAGAGRSDKSCCIQKALASQAFAII